MKYVIPILFGLFLATWFLNWPILSSQFDLESCAEQYRFWRVRAVVYECMFMALVVVCFMLCRGLAKAFACFAIIMIAGSIVDKVFFNISSYVGGDAVLIILGVIASFIIYGRDRDRT